MLNRKTLLVGFLGVALATAFASTMKGVHLFNSLIDSTVIGGTIPSTGNFTGINTNVLSMNATAYPAGYTLASNGSSFVPTAPQVSTAGSGYVVLPGGVIEEWMTGPTQGDNSGAFTLNYPTPFPHGVLSIQATPLLTAGYTDDTHGPTYSVVSSSTSSVTLQRQRLADHGSTSSQPYVLVIGY